MTRPAPVRDGLTGPTAIDDSTILTLLHDLVRSAAAAAPGVTACLVSLLSPQGDVVVSSADPTGRAVPLADGEFHVGGGPALRSARDGRVVLVADLATEGPWGVRALQAGVRSSSSHPLVVDAGTRGAVTFLAAEPGTAVDPVHAAHTAGRVAGLLTAAARLGERDGQVAQLRQAVESRTVIGQAVGLLMAQSRSRADTSLEAIKRQSQHANRKVRDIAEELVATHEAMVGRAVAAAAGPAPAELPPAPAPVEPDRPETPPAPPSDRRPVETGVLVLHRGGPHAGRVRSVPSDLARQALVYERDLAVYRPEVPARVVQTPQGPAQVWVCT